MAVNKVIFGGETVIDLTGDNVTADALVTGYTAHGKNGEPIQGANPYEKAATDAAVIDIANAIADKGVTVPDGTLIDGMAALIESIEAGSGGVAEPKFRTGYITITGASPASTQTKVAAVAGLDITPVCVYIQRGSYVNITSTSQNQFLTVFSAPGEKTLSTRGLVNSGNARVYTGNEMIAYVTAIDGGFELYNGDFSNMHYDSSYQYIAVGY